MTAYEYLKELIFRDTLAPWESHSITIFTTSALAMAASLVMRKWALSLEDEIHIAATAFESQESMIITDANGVILRVNHAFTEATGYTAEEAIGQTPRLLKSGRHDADFYRAMWDSLLRTGAWRGEIWDKKKNGDIFPTWLTISAVKGDDGTTTHYVAARLDMSEHKAAEEEIRNLAFYDSLTGLPNRRLLLNRLHQALASSARSGRNGALLFIDLDNFKNLNDTLGHDIGDLLLQQVAQRLESCVREGDTVARLGGDEFVVMLENLYEQEIEAAAQAEAVGKKILVVLNQPYQLAAHEYRSTPSIGATLLNGNQSDVDELFKQADIAMYHAKNTGRNALHFFDPAMQTAINTRVTLESDLRRAIAEQKQFLLHYQAQVDSSGYLVGAEALVRWQHPVRGLLLPSEFIPLAEESGLILPLGHWVLATACQQLAIWAKQAETAHLTMAVNVSSRQFHQPVFVEEVLALVEYFGVDPTKLKLEITESLLLEDVDDTVTKMAALQARGVSFSMDDFGTGYSSLSRLKNLPLFQLKIDKSFVRDVLTNRSDASITKIIVALAQSMNLEIIAEGVETEAQRNFLELNGCHTFQGHLFGKPAPIEQFEIALQQH